MKKIITFIALAFCYHTNAQIITTVAGSSSTGGYSGDGGQATAALLKNPNQLAFDAAGNLFVAEDYNHIIRKISPGGVISTVAGTGTMGFSGDGGQATAAQLNRACGVAVDAAGNLYICDSDNSRIRKVNTAGIITTIAGNGTAGNMGDDGAATSAEIGFTSGICLDATGNVYIATQNGSYGIRKISTAGIITNFAGNGTSGYSGDGGQATAAQLSGSASLCFDATGNLYIGDFGGMRVRKVNTAGIISTFAGNGNFGSTGDGGQATAAELFYPYGVAADAAGNVYIADAVNNKIRKVDASGIISTFAGTGGFTGGYGGDGGLAINAQLNNPSAVCLSASGDVYIGDYANNVIRKVAMSTTTGMNGVFNNTNQINFYPNPSKGSFVIEPGNSAKQTLQLYDAAGKLVLSQTINGKITIDTSNLSEGVYNATITGSNGLLLSKKVVIVK